MDPYSRGFRDGAAEACQSMTSRLRDAIEVVEEPMPIPVYSQEKVAELLKLLARSNEQLAAQIQAVGEDDDDAHEDEKED